MMTFRQQYSESTMRFWVWAMLPVAAVLLTLLVIGLVIQQAPLCEAALAGNECAALR